MSFISYIYMYVCKGTEEGLNGYGEPSVAEFLKSSVLCTEKQNGEEAGTQGWAGDLKGCLCLMLIISNFSLHMHI